jgi:hypothetical protein
MLSVNLKADKLNGHKDEMEKDGKHIWKGRIPHSRALYIISGDVRHPRILKSLTNQQN